MGRILKWFGAFIAVALLAVGAFVFLQVRSFDSSMSKVYTVPLRTVSRSKDPLVLERGKHLTESLGACTSCHGERLGGGKTEAMGPLGTFVMSNITTGRDGKGGEYSDAELARLIKHGIRRDGTSARFMPAQDWSWWPDEDVDAVISWIRAQPPMEGNPGEVQLSFLAKVLDRLDALPLDVARRLDHANLPSAPKPAPDSTYGAYVAGLCKDCHGATLSGGAIPGGPPNLPIPSNLTAHETGLKDWTYADFTKLMREGKRRNGKALDPFMPIGAFKNFNETEMQALWAYLEALPARPFGNR